MMMTAPQIPGYPKDPQPGDPDYVRLESNRKAGVNLSSR
jgi:hypothetical protein